MPAEGNCFFLVYFSLFELSLKIRIDLIRIWNISSNLFFYTPCLLGDEQEAIELNDKKTKSKNKDDDKEKDKDEETKFKKKEQSVLQAKLTKLAIQIGYAGKQIFL